MPPDIYRQGDVKPELLRELPIAIVGYGNQGRAQAQNLRDSGYDIVVGAAGGRPSAERARRDGFAVLPVDEAVRRAGAIAVLLPDESHGTIYAREIGPHLTAGKLLVFAHGFSIHYQTIVPPADVDVVLVAPKGAGSMVRRLYVEGTGTAALVAVAQNASGRALELALAYAAGLGAGRVGMLRTTFREETETDLFGEQAVLCGGLSALIKAGFETLVAAGYQPELAYFECLHEIKLIVDLIYERGLTGMRAAISNTAEYGDLTRGPRLVGPAVRQAMSEILAEIQSGEFARAWLEENAAGCANLQTLRQAEDEHPVERVGARLRSLLGLGQVARDRGEG